VTGKAFKDGAAFGAWLAKHGATKDELLVRLWKVHAAHHGMGYQAALDEALCRASSSAPRALAGC
jgi:hypothetical protein